MVATRGRSQNGATQGRSSGMGRNDGDDIGARFKIQFGRGTSRPAYERERLFFPLGQLDSDVPTTQLKAPMFEESHTYGDGTNEGSGSFIRTFSSI